MYFGQFFVFYIQTPIGYLLFLLSFQISASKYAASWNKEETICPCPKKSGINSFREFQTYQSVRFINTVDRAGIKNLDKLFTRDFREIKSIEGIGVICITRLGTLLNLLGINLDDYFKREKHLIKKVGRNCERMKRNRF
jgi:hypothetical protein